MDIKFPFIYAIEGVPFRARKQRTYFVRETITFTLRELSESEVQVAAWWEESFRYKAGTSYRRNLFFALGRLWMYRTTCNGVGIDDTLTTRTELIEAICASRSEGNPFYQRHGLASYREAQSNLDDLPELEQLQHDKVRVVSSSRATEVARLQGIADSMAVFGDLVLVQDREWGYQVKTFGLGSNHGLGKGTHLELCHIPVSTPVSQGVFALTELEAAIRYTEDVANRRRDTKAIPVMPDTAVTVLLPEAFVYRSANVIIQEDAKLSAEQLSAKYAASPGEDHPVFICDEWISAVRGRSTRQSYWDWVQQQLVNEVKHLL